MTALLLTALLLAACEGTPGNAPRCGDGSRDLGELCDGSDLGGQTCVSMGYLSGTLLCTAQCQFDFSACFRISDTCGDGVRDADEQCDGDDLNSQSCEGLGYEGGALACNTQCRYAVEGCEGEPCEGAHCDDECRDDEDCAEDERCVDTFCLPTCQGDLDCGPGAICVGELCQEGCNDDAGCLWFGQRCEDGACVEPPCLRSDDCNVGAVCKDKECQIVPCATDGDCPPGTLCQVDPAGRCVECLTAEDCTLPGSYECVDDHCLLLCEDDAVDNDSPARAKPLANPADAAAPLEDHLFVRFTLCGRDEQDWYRLLLHPGRQYTITAHFASPPLGTGPTYEGVEARLYAGRDFTKWVASAEMSPLSSQDVVLSLTTGPETSEHYLLLSLDTRKYEAHYDIRTAVQ